MKKPTKSRSKQPPLITEPSSPWKPRVKRDHVAQEYQDRADSSTARDLCKHLTPRARRCVLTGREDA